MFIERSGYLDPEPLPVLSSAAFWNPHFPICPSSCYSCSANLWSSPQKQTAHRESCSDSALSLCRRILPGDRSCGTQWMIHCASDCLESAQHSQSTLTFAVADINLDVAESSVHTVHISAQRCWFLLTTTFQAAAVISKMSYNKPHDRKCPRTRSHGKISSVLSEGSPLTLTKEEEMLHLLCNCNMKSASFWKTSIFQQVCNPI